MTDPGLTRRLVLAQGAAGLLLAAGVATARAADELPAEAVDVFNFALLLEHLEADFYAQGLDTDGLIPQRDREVFATLAQHEATHVDFLTQALGGQADPKPTFDFSAGGAFDPFTDYRDYRVLSVAFEDTGVRAYKGQAIAEAARTFLKSPSLLTKALTIHSVEARHAARVRQLLGFESWFPGAFPGAPLLIKPVYATDPKLTEKEPAFDVRAINPFGVKLGSASGLGGDRIQEAFDEPLGMTAVRRIASLFIDRS